MAKSGERHSMDANGWGTLSSAAGDFRCDLALSNTIRIHALTGEQNGEGLRKEPWDGGKRGAR